MSDFLYKELIEEFFIKGLSGYLDNQGIDKLIEQAVEKVVESYTPRKEVLSPDEARKVLGISRNTFDVWEKNDEFPAYRRGTKVIVPIPALRHFLEYPEWFERHGLDKEKIEEDLSKYEIA